MKKKFTKIAPSLFFLFLVGACNTFVFSAEPGEPAAALAASSEDGLPVSCTDSSGAALVEPLSSPGDRSPDASLSLCGSFQEVRTEVESDSVTAELPDTLTAPLGDLSDDLPLSEQDISSVPERPLGIDEGNIYDVPRITVVGIAGDGSARRAKEKDIKAITDRAISKRQSQFTVGQLQQVADEITQYYRSLGFVLAFAVVPEQTALDGNVVLRVREGTFGDTRVVGGRGAREQRTWLGDIGWWLQGDGYYWKSVLKRPFLPLIGKPIQEKKITSALLRLTDYPGLAAFGVFQPGKRVGESDLEIRVQNEERLSGRVSYDNFGLQELGKNRVVTSLSVINPSGIGDQVDLAFVRNVNDTNSLFWSAGYSLILPYRMRFGGYFQRTTFAFMDERPGSGEIAIATERAELFLEKSIIRSRAQNLSVRASGLIGNSEARLDSARTSLDRTAVLSMLIDYDLVDTRFRGVNYIALEWRHGFPDLFGSAPRDPSELSIESRPSRSRSGPRRTTLYAESEFDVFRLSYTRLQSLYPHIALFVRSDWQYSGDFLQSSELYASGGPSHVRGYTDGEMQTEKGFFISAELVLDAPFFADKEAFLFGKSLEKTWGELLQLKMFYDAAAGRLNFPQSGDQIGYRFIDSAGFGLSAGYPDRFQSTLTMAWALKDPKEDVNNGKKPQVWWGVTLLF